GLQLLAPQLAIRRAVVVGVEKDDRVAVLRGQAGPPQVDPQRVHAAVSALVELRDYVPWVVIRVGDTVGAVVVGALAGPARELRGKVRAPGEVSIVAGPVVGRLGGAAVHRVHDLVACRRRGATAGARPEITVAQLDAHRLAGVFLARGWADDLEPPVRRRDRERGVGVAGGAAPRAVVHLICRIVERSQAGTGAALPAALNHSPLLEIVVGEVGAPAHVGTCCADGKG